MARSAKKDLFRRTKPKDLLKRKELAFSRVKNKPRFECKNPQSNPKIWPKIWDLGGS
jgi:hypothetical protein